MRQRLCAGPEQSAPAPDLPQVVEVTLGQDAHTEDVRWRISISGSPHLFVLGIPGQGKSVTTRRILSSFADQGLPALVIDFHGDMAGGGAVLDASLGLPISPAGAFVLRKVYCAMFRWGQTM
ncbi:MAG: hypothetical protein QOG20_3643 [Pseudonocardiales bacterium]|nr:hypothetical protein [Pseudonocardiales bacterium]